MGWAVSISGFPLVVMQHCLRLSLPESLKCEFFSSPFFVLKIIVMYLLITNIKIDNIFYMVIYLFLKVVQLGTLFGSVLNSYETFDKITLSWL